MLGRDISEDTARGVAVKNSNDNIAEMLPPDEGGDDSVSQLSLTLKASRSLRVRPHTRTCAFSPVSAARRPTAKQTPRVVGRVLTTPRVRPPIFARVATCRKTRATRRRTRARVTAKMPPVLRCVHDAGVAWRITLCPHGRVSQVESSCSRTRAPTRSEGLPAHQQSTGLSFGTVVPLEMAAGCADCMLTACGLCADCVLTACWLRAAVTRSCRRLHKPMPRPRQRSAAPR